MVSKGLLESDEMDEKNKEEKPDTVDQ